METLFPLDDIPSTDLKKFMVCNSADSLFVYKKDFYTYVKDVILKKHGHEAGYDIQKIKKECWSCDGSGTFWSGECCRSCGGTGIYAIRTIALKRYSLNGKIFHSPLSFEQTQAVIAKEKINKTIDGIIKHTSPPSLGILPTQAYFDLLEKYNPEAYIVLNKQLQDVVPNTNSIQDELPF